jgi:hypothetical protein
MRTGLFLLGQCGIQKFWQVWPLGRKLFGDERIEQRNPVDACARRGPCCNGANRLWNR